MGQLQQQIEKRLKLEGYSYRTRKIYIQHMKLFVAYHTKDPGSWHPLILNAICFLEGEDYQPIGPDYEEQKRLKVGELQLRSKVGLAKPFPH